jgi:hypothetical protein
MNQGTEQEFNVGEADESVRIAAARPTITLPDDVVAVAPSSNLQGVTRTASIDKAERISTLPLILEKIHDPNYPLEEVNRLIAIEIAFVAQEMRDLCNKVHLSNQAETFLQKSFEQQVKALQALEKSLTSTDILRQRDVLNLDGPKFEYVFGELVSLFKRSCQEALGKENETMVNSIMKHYRDGIAMMEPELRKNVDKVKVHKNNETETTQCTMGQ